MIINESGLVRALKSAFKRTGYAILGNPQELTIYTENWYIRADWDKIPRKALATLVEHMGMLPGPEDALLISAADDPQIAIPEIVGQDVNNWENGEHDSVVTLVPVMVRGLQLYQEEEGSRCYGVNPVALGIADRSVAVHKEATVTRNCRLSWEHDGERVVLACVRPADTYWEKEYEKEIWKAMESVDLHRRDD